MIQKNHRMMGVTDPEPLQESSENQAVSGSGWTNEYATTPVLVEIFSAWDHLPDTTKAKILALVRRHSQKQI
jgi:hypothetical protein